MTDHPVSLPEVITVEVAFANPESQRVIELQVRSGAHAREAVKQSDIAAEFPEIDPDHCSLGVFGERVGDDYALMHGDRVEIYRPLRVDPREARRERARRPKRLEPGDNSS
jgi:putative ubiquitin-RnfH superfamily antitoxin RatB of RatAB toxin-antitoxin module